MPHVFVSAVIGADAGRVWEAIRDFNALPLDEAKQRAAKLEKQIRELARSRQYDLRLVPAK